MSIGEQGEIAPAQVIRDLEMGDLRAALAAGWADFRAFPAFGLFFAAIYVAAGLLLYQVLVTRGAAAWLVPAAAGFPLLGPFVAVGLYEVSRCREAGLPVRWGAVLGALRGHGDEQLLSMGVIVFVGFGFWLMIAHAIFAVFMAESGAGAETLAVFFTGPGLMMLMVGSVVGGLLALAFYAVTVLSLPMLLDRPVDFPSAIIASVGAVRANPAVFVVWAVVIAVSLFAALVPLFLGLFVVLPVLGHATWHLYRRSIGRA